MADTNNEATVIGSDTRIKGEVSFEQAARILGSVEGKIEAKGELRIAEGATCKATIDASRLSIDGEVEGDIAASDRVELSAKARVRGDLTASKLVVAEGASFVGHCRVGPDAGRGSGPSRPSGATEVKPSMPATKVDAGAKG